MDVTDCRNLPSLQTVIFMTLFLQCSAKLATCYAYIGVCLRSALRMGMHRSLNEGCGPIETEVRKRCFWIIRKMDVFVSMMLGLPLALSDEDFDQDFPAEVDDEFITEDGIQPQPADRVPFIRAVNHDFRLANIVCRIVRRIYPIKPSQTASDQARAETRVKLSVVKDIETDLKAWEESLDPIFKPDSTAGPRIMRFGLSVTALDIG